MGVRELRAALRKEREARVDDNEANEKLLEKKDKKLNELAKKSFEPWDERMADLTDELHTCSLGASEVLTRVFSSPRRRPAGRSTTTTRCTRRASSRCASSTT
jgi:hypothetical protein